AGTVPSAPVVGYCRLQASRERVVARQRAVRDRDLSPARDAELLTKNIGVRLRRPRGNAKSLADLVVRTAGSDELDHLDLARREARNRSSQSVIHGREANARPRAAPLTERCISRVSDRGANDCNALYLRLGAATDFPRGRRDACRFRTDRRWPGRRPREGRRMQAARLGVAVPGDRRRTRVTRARAGGHGEDWNRTATSILIQFPPTGGGAPPALQVNMGMVQGAVSDEV